MDEKLATMYHETGYFTTRLTIPKLGVFGNFKNLYPFHWLRPLTQIFHHLKDHQGVVDGYQLFLLHLTRAFCFGHDMSWHVMTPKKSRVSPVFFGSSHDRKVAEAPRGTFLRSRLVPQIYEATALCLGPFLSGMRMGRRIWAQVPGKMGKIMMNHEQTWIKWSTQVSHKQFLFAFKKIWD